MSVVKCGFDILGVVYIEKEDPSARRTLDSRITFHWVSMQKFCGWLWSCCKICICPQHFWLHLASFLGTVSTQFFGLTSYLGNRTTVKTHFPIYFFCLDHINIHPFILVGICSLASWLPKLPSPRFRSEEFFVYEISEEMFYPNL